MSPLLLGEVGGRFKDWRRPMAQRMWSFAKRESKVSSSRAALVLFALWLGSSFNPAFAQQPGQQTFASAQAAARAFCMAAEAPEQDALLRILGPDGKDILSSGDPVEDLKAREHFLVKYQEMHRFVKNRDGSVTLIIGAENWPFPIPLVSNHGSWYFDTAAGKKEILCRRIGRNETAAMDASRDLVQAQQQYFQYLPPNQKQFARKLLSDDGRHDGLYWQGTYNEFASPINSLIAYATGRNAGGQGADPVPFNGYFFRVLTSQGPHAPGGARNYLLDGKMTGGFAFVAYPAEYRSSGVMTFIVNESGIIYEQDFGPNTTRIAEAMSTYDPDSTWHRVN
jgi:Protein of unknown function (DUF2950)